jgi:hypothetical protein
MDLSQKHFERAAQHHAAVSKCHRGIANAAQKSMRKAEQADLDIESLGDFLESFIEEHNALADEHAEMSEFCSTCSKTAGVLAMEAAEKAAKDRFSATVVSDNVHKVVPTRPGFTPVVRMGEPTPSAAAAVGNVPLEFQKLVSVE